MQLALRPKSSSDQAPGMEIADSTSAAQEKPPSASRPEGPNTPSTPSQATIAARNAVINTYELLENIISHLGVEQIVEARGVSTAWCDIIQRSKTIREKIRCSGPQPLQDDDPGDSPLYALRTPINFNSCVQPTRSYFQQCYHGAECSGELPSCASIITHHAQVAHWRGSFDELTARYSEKQSTAALTTHRVQAVLLRVSLHTADMLVVVEETSLCVYAKDGVHIADVWDAALKVAKQWPWHGFVGCILTRAELRVKSDWSPWAFG